MMNPLLTGRLAIKRLYDHEMAPLMARFTLTRMELDVLLFLSNNPGFDTAAEIVQLRMLTKSHVSKAVDHLTERGLIQQARDEKNRRRVHLTLTDAAQAVVVEARDAQRRAVEQLMAGISAEDTVVLDRVMRQVVRNAALVIESKEG